MTILKINMENVSPASFSAGRAVSNTETTLDYVPGSALRGALAKLWLASGGDISLFEKIFVRDGVIFCNFYKENSSPIPQSVVSCKYYSGFKNDDRHGVYDMAALLIKNGNTPMRAEHSFCQCKISEDKLCNAPMKKFRGYYQTKDGSYSHVAAAKRIIYHTAIDFFSETASDGSLYSIEVMNEGQGFAGEIIIQDSSAIPAFESFMRGIKELSLGQDKTRGLGKFRVISQTNETIADETIAAASLELLRQRHTTLNQLIGADNTRSYFTITLKVEAVLTDKYMRYQACILPEDIGVNAARLEHAFNGVRLCSGWNALARLPKEDVAAITKGSVFIYSVPVITDKILKQLALLEKNGIGRRLGEGFGRLRVCDEFHIQGETL